jgi:tetratricopeptide (TPR) repeat protein
LASRTVFVSALALSLSTAALAEPLLGPGVGNADTLVSEGTKLYNRKSYPKAAEHFLKATRASPTTLSNYAALARALMLAKQVPKACYAYRVYLKAAPDSPDRKKAAAESDQCERQVRPSKAQADLLQSYVDGRAAFFSALDRNELLGEGGAALALETLVKQGFLGPELTDMGQKLAAAATAEADSIHKRALAGEAMTTETLRQARPLYQVAQDVGLSSPEAKARMAFLDGLAELREKNFKKAETHFVEATRADPANKEYVFYRALAIYQAGDRATALKVLEAELKDDPRTAVLRAAQAVSHAPELGATELEQLLFSTRYPPEK